MYLQTMVERIFNGRKDTGRMFRISIFQLQATFGPVIPALRELFEHT